MRDPLNWMPVKRQITHQHIGDDRVLSVLIDSIKTDRDLQHNDLGADVHVVVKLFHVFIEHADAARRGSGAD